MKLLSPAGNFESLKTAVYNGADEVYLGINDFNARNNIDGFSLQTLPEAINFAHVYGVKVFLAINILFDDSELQSALDTAVAAHNMGVDAFIIQDLGLALLLKKYYPALELHASTQMGLHNLEGVKFAVETCGFRRVVLSRETPLEEIKRIKDNIDVEIEYFVQGALCVSFSGNCYMSSYLFGASGNRGKCKQLCRLPFTLKKDGKPLKTGYLLSAKEFDMSSRLEDLKVAGVDSLKIEGRARRPYYVGAVTREYRRLLDGNGFNRRNIEVAFNRGYTAGYFDGNGKIISELQNHIGVPVGKVEKIKGGKTFNEVFFYSQEELSPKSTFKVFSGGQEKTVLTAYDLTRNGNTTYRLTTTQNLSVGDRLNLIADAGAEEELLKFTRRQKVCVDFYAKVGQPIKAVYTVNGSLFESVGETLLPAQKQPLKKEDFEEKFSKNEYFDVKVNVCELEQVFIPKSQFNAFRRKVFSDLFFVFANPLIDALPSVKIETGGKVIPFTDFEFVSDINENFTRKNIVYSPENYNACYVKSFIEKCERLNKTPYLDTPNFALKKDIQLLERIVGETGVKIVANNYYALKLNAEKVIGGGLNVYNSVAANFYGLPIIAAENGVINQTDFPVMTLRHCPMKSHLKADCKNCPFESGYTYQMESGQEFNLSRKKLSTCTFYLKALSQRTVDKER